MNQSRYRPEPLVDYPYHLPDKPIPTGDYITYEEFFDWADEDTLAEWVDGRIDMGITATYPHQEVAGLLYEILDTYSEMLGLGEVMQFPFQMKLPTSGRTPDLIFVAKANQARLENALLRGPADLVVEITSQESQWRDRYTKFQEYAAGGVPEYWLIDPELQTAEFYRLDKQGHYQGQLLDAEGRYHSLVIPGFWLKPAWFWQEPMPAARKILKQVGGQTYLNSFDEPSEPDL